MRLFQEGTQFKFWSGRKLIYPLFLSPDTFATGREEFKSSVYVQGLSICDWNADYHSHKIRKGYFWTLVLCEVYTIGQVGGEPWVDMQNRIWLPKGKDSWKATSIKLSGIWTVFKL